MTTDTQYMTVTQAARAFNVSEASLRNRIARGVLASKKVGYARMIERDLLARLLARGAR
jgi:excisionase family DNA binding protein